MGFYDLTKEERLQQTEQIYSTILRHFETSRGKPVPFFSSGDTYIRKSAYQSVGKVFHQRPDLRDQIILLLEKSIVDKDPHIRQTTINAAGEIGLRHFATVESFFDRGLFDDHHSVRNAFIGSMKKMGQKNPGAVLQWAKNYLHHPDKEIRRQICHGIELRGRTHPEDILPMLKELQHDPAARVRNTLVHVLGQISYKKNCLAAVILHLKMWEEKELIAKAIVEIIDVHERYKDFAFLSPQEAQKYIDNNF